jgi:hypothetical protein
VNVQLPDIPRNFPRGRKKLSRKGCVVLGIVAALDDGTGRGVSPGELDRCLVDASAVPLRNLSKNACLLLGAIAGSCEGRGIQSADKVDVTALLEMKLTHEAILSALRELGVTGATLTQEAGERGA